MGQSTTGTNLVTNTAASSRQVCYRVRFDWADAGFGHESTWTNETAYVESLTGDLQAVDSRRSIAMIGRSVADSCTVTLRNPEVTSGGSGLRFSSSNASGPLYAHIGDGKILMKRAVVELGFYDGSTPEYTRQLTGYTVDAPEDFDARTIRLELKDRTAAFVDDQQSSALYTNYSAGSYLSVLASLLGKDASPASHLDSGIVPLQYAWLDDDNLWEEMSLVAEAQGGRVYWDKDGELHLEDGAHFVKPQANSYDDPTVSQFTFTVDDFRTLQPRYDPESIANDIIIEYQPRYLGQPQVVYSLSEKQLVIPPGGWATTRIETHCEHRYPCLWTYDVDQYGTVEAVTSGGVDMFSDIDIISVTSNCHETIVVIRNDSYDYAAYITKLEIVGVPLLSAQASKYAISDATSITRYGRKTLRITNPYVFNYRHAQFLGDFLLQRFKDPVQTAALRGVRGVPWLEPGDRVTVIETKTGINEAYLIGRLHWSFIPGQPYVMDLELMPVSDLFQYSNYFILGTSRYGTGSGKGRVFW